ncbi:hypothetical protein [Actinomycetospora lemnae]|uniref:Uncharacterized protein n=1 Tax=Actinomycetospora lemnae TaxID=3019891 RepID=A0ABT5SZ30_9PSEU|nr:hypothetical protein [Actinomycetospora sp. DW7H6]MDD7968014.1 hypothetical protein [Actinomycetospora sp. DW7H6]
MAPPPFAVPVRALARALADVLDLGAEAGVAVGLLTADALGALPRPAHRAGRGDRPSRSGRR